MDKQDEKILPLPKTARMSYGHFLVVCYLMLASAYREQKQKSQVFQQILDDIKSYDENMATALENIRYCIQNETDSGVLVDTELLIEIGRKAGFQITKQQEKTFFKDLNNSAEEISKLLDEYHQKTGK